MLSATRRREFLDSAAGHDLVECCFLGAGLAEDSTEPLDVLAHRPRPRKNHRDIRFRHVDSFVQNPRRRNNWVFTRIETKQNVSALFCFGLMRDNRYEELPCDFINCRIVVSENQDSVAVMAFQQSRK